MNRQSELAMTGGEPVLSSGMLRRWPEITPDDRAAMNSVDEIWGIHGKQATALQDEWAEYCGARYCQAVSTGTAAVRCAVVAARVQPGDEVILPAFGYVASGQAVLLSGAKPVFCDINPATFTLDVEKLIPLITGRTRAIMPVYVHGLVCDTAAVTAVAETHGLAVIPDAAQAAGATDGGRRAGTGAFGICTAFSLNGQKPFQAGEGGLVTTDDPETLTAVALFASLGEARPRALRPGEVRESWARWAGDQLRLDEIKAALARSQLKRLDEYLARARQNAGLLATGLSEIPGFAPPDIPEDSESSHYRLRVRLNPEPYGWEDKPEEFRDRVLYALQLEGVAVDTWQLKPLPAHPVFRRSDFTPWSPGIADGPLRPWCPEKYPVASALLSSSITIGAHPYPLHVQPPEVMRLFLRAFAKVAKHMAIVLRADYEPVRPAPPIPATDLRST